jgi:pilus assembly protein CpaE
MTDVPKVPVGPDGTTLNVALLGPDEHRRGVLAGALTGHKGIRFKEFASYPPRLVDLPQALSQQYQVIVVDIDSNPDYALKLIEGLCTSGQTYVMAYSAQADTKTAVRFMRAGVREFFTLPLDPAEITAALTRAATHQPTPIDPSKAPGKLMVFLGTKGGCGVTTLGANFALALAQESSKAQDSSSETLLIDLGLPLGDVAINLGLPADYSLAPALQNPERLDAAMLATLVTKHDSGLWVLAAPTELPEKAPTIEAIDKLLAVAREKYTYVVVDAGSRIDLMGSTLFQPSAIIYLVTQVGISEMRNTNRLVLKYFTRRDENLQLIVNRYKSSDLVFDETQITKALTRPADWKIPDDYAAARRTRNTPTPLALADSPISHAIREMAQAAAGVVPEKKKSIFRIFG